jgi:elongation factor Ts
MPEISAATVKALRDETGLPMMDCKRALQEAGGDVEAAKDLLHKQGKKKMAGRADRATAFGRVAVYCDREAAVGAIIDLQCESAPVAANEEFIQLADDLVRQLATGPGASTPAELLAQPSPSQAPKTLQQQLDGLSNRIREVFKLARILRVDRPCGGYTHHTGSPGVLLVIEGGSAELAKDICMHVAAMRPPVLAVEDLDPELVAKERAVQADLARQEGKPEKIIDKMVDGRMRNFYAENCLLEQPFVKDDKQTVGKVAKAGGMKIAAFHRWELGKE